MTDRPIPPDPFDFLPELPTFTVESDSFVDGEPHDAVYASGAFGVPGGEDRAPHLRWSGFPPETRSFAITVFDPDAPTISGFWHWAVCDIPLDITEIAEGGQLPEGAVELRNDAGFVGYVGSGPPPGHGPHRYITTIHAVDVESLGVGPEATSAFMGFNLFGHAIARAHITPTFER